MNLIQKKQLFEKKENITETLGVEKNNIFQGFVMKLYDCALLSYGFEQNKVKIDSFLRL